MNNPSVQYSRDPQSMKAAAENARATFKYFWRELAWDLNRITPLLVPAAVKLPILGRPSDGSPAKVEHVWIGDVQFDGYKVSGKLLNTPLFETSLRAGDLVSESLSLVDDWLYAMGGKVYGGFTVDVLRSRMSPTELKAHDAEWGPLEFGLPGKVFVVPTVAVDSQKSLRLEETAEWPEHPLSESMAVSLESLIKERPELLTHFDENGRSLLHHEVLKGSAAMVAELLKRGAKPLARDKTGVSAKDLAEKMGWSQIVRLFDEELRTLSPGHKIFAFIVTDIGKIKIELEADRAPKTVAHFLECAKTGFYNNTLCNRILDFSVFFAQDAKLKNMVYEQTVESESSNGLKNLRYTLAMVPLAGNPHSAAGAFFINLDCNDMLDYQGEDSVGYTVFGRVTEGFDVVENIRTANTLTRCSGHEVPMKAVVVEKIHVQETQLRRAKT